MSESLPKPKGGAPSKSAIKNAARKRNLRKYQNDQFNLIAEPVKGMTPEQIINAFKSSQNQNHQKVLDKVNELNSKITGLTRGYVAQRAYNKAGVKNLAALKAKLDQDSIDYSGITDKQLLDLIALDDWGTIASMAWPLIKKFGAPVLAQLYNQHVKPKIDKWMGGDEGLNPADWGSVLGPRRYTGVPGENVEMPGVKSVFGQIGSFKTVDPKSIASTLCPETFKHRYAYTETMKTAIGIINFELSVVTNASGSVGVAMMPLNAAVNGSSYQLSFCNIYNDATFSLITGGQTPAATFTAGPLSGSTSSIDILRVTNVAVQVLPTASFNTAGSFTLGYNNRFSGLGLSSTNLGTTLSQLKTFPFVTSFNNKTTARMINVTGDSADESFVITSSFNQHQYFVLLGSGLPASTECCKILINAAVEFVPSVSALPICVMDYPRVGPLTEQFESMMFMRYPVLQQLDLQDANRIANALPEYPTNFDELMSKLSSLVSGIQPRQYVPHVQAMDLALPGESVDFLIE